MRRLFLSYMVFIGLGCIIFTLLSQATNNVEEILLAENTATKRPVLLSKSNHSPNTNATLLAKNATEKSPDAVAVAAASEIADSSLGVWQTITVQVGDTLSKVFERAGVAKTSLTNLMSSGKPTKELATLYPGQELNFLVDHKKDLKALKLNVTNTKTLEFTNEGSKFKHAYAEQTPIKKLNFSKGKIAGSLYSSAQTAGLDDKLIMQMADILGYDIDFTLDIRDDDFFRVLYEEEFVDEKKIQPGKILALEFSNQGKLYKAVRYKDAKCGKF